MKVATAARKVGSELMLVPIVTLRVLADYREEVTVCLFFLQRSVCFIVDRTRYECSVRGESGITIICFRIIEAVVETSG